MKKIIMVAAVFPPEPVVSATLLFDLAFKLSETYSVTVLRPKPTRPYGFNFSEDDTSEYPFEVITLNSYTCPASSLVGRLRESYSFGRAITNYISTLNYKVDLLYITAWPLFAKYQISKIAKQIKIPYVVAVQDVYPEALLTKLPNKFGIRKRIIQLLMPIDKFVLKNAALIHTISPKMREYLSDTRGIEITKFVSVRNWQNEKEFLVSDNYNPTDSSSPMVFMYLGNIGPLAGLEMVLHAFEGIEPSDAKLIIAGSGSEKEKLRKIVEEKKLPVEFWEVPKGKVGKVQSNADVMILPVKKGGALMSIPSKLPAYMFSKKPIIAAVDEESDTAYCINSAKCGWVIPPEDSEALKDLLIECIKIDRKTLKIMGNNGFVYGMQELSKEANLQKLYEFIIKSIE